MPLLKNSLRASQNYSTSLMTPRRTKEWFVSVLAGEQQCLSEVPFNSPGIH